MSTVSFKNIKGHLKTVHNHRKLVRQYCFKCGLYKQGLFHDWTKYLPSELIPSIVYYQGYRSPYPFEKEKKGYSLGWLHHKGHNKHHWEYWYDVIKGEWIPIKMPYNYLVESICDRIAACKTYNKEKYTDADALNYFTNKKDGRYMHPESANEMLVILTMLENEGEEKTFSYLKEQLKIKKDLNY